MPVYILVPFSVFFLCALSQFWFVKLVRDALIDRHPDAYLRAERSSFFAGGGLYRFIVGNRSKALLDVELDRRVRNVRLLYLVALIAWLAIPISLVLATL
jgi:hypothetical protein